VNKNNTIVNNADKNRIFANGGGGTIDIFTIAQLSKQEQKK
jgi:hypothetical protein